MLARLGRAALVVAAASATALGTVGTGTLVTLGEEGVPGNAGSFEGSVANNGKVVAFYSDASNLVGDDDNGTEDVFVRDLRSGAVELISRDADGNPGNSWSDYPTLSANGRWVMYYTQASNLAIGASLAGNEYQAVIHDRRTGDTTTVSTDFEGGPADGNTELYDTRPLSGNGRWAVIYTAATDIVEGDTNGKYDVFLFDLRTGARERISNGIAGESDGDSRYASISPNGRYVTFVSNATNLVPDDANGFWDTFVYDVKRRTTTLVSRASNGDQGNGNSGGTSEYATAITNNGRWAVFRSGATNFDAVTADTNGFDDIFLRDLRAGTTTRLSIKAGGVQADARSGDPFIHPAGKWVSYFTYAGNLVDATDDVSYDQIFHDVRTGTNRRMLAEFDGKAAGDTSGNYGYWNGMSANGRWFACTTDTGAIHDDGLDTNDDWDVYLVGVK